METRVLKETRAAAFAFAGVLAAAFSAAPRTIVDLSSVSVPTIVGEAASEEFGYDIGAGDLDGDGEVELAVGAPGHSSDGTGPEAGAVYVIDAEALAGLEASVGAPEVARSTIVGNTPHSRFGERVLVSDLNHDGTDDLVVAAPTWDAESGLAVGRIYLFFGPLPAGTSAPDAADATVSGDASGDHFGSCLAAGDLNGDGVPELVVSAFRAGAPEAPFRGAVYIIEITGLEAITAAASAVSASVILGEASGDALRGISILDLDGDGSPELALGAYHADGPADDRIDIGKMYIVSGGKAMQQSRAQLPHDAEAVVLGPEPRGLLGRALAAGDIDGDGFTDILASAYASRCGSHKEEASGEAFVLFGGHGGLPDTLDLAVEQPVVLKGRARWDLFGLPVDVSDLNGDGAGDIIVAAQFADGPGGSRRRCGEVYVYWGSLRSVLVTKGGSAELADVTIVGERALDCLGAALIAADLTADPSLDLVLGAPDAHGEEGAPLVGKISLVPSHMLLKRQTD